VESPAVLSVVAPFAEACPEVACWSWAGNVSVPSQPSPMHAALGSSLPLLSSVLPPFWEAIHAESVSASYVFWAYAQDTEKINTDKKEMILERSIYLNYNKSGAKTDS
jgi:hypothetical protein